MIRQVTHQRMKRLFMGGARIDALTGEGTGEDTLFSEDWIASDVAPGVSCTLQGTPLTELLEREGERLVGRASFAAYGPRMPILAKLLDTTQRLAVQAHPTVAFAREHFHSPFGKTECWYILEAAPGAGVYLGFKPGITRKIWQKCFETQQGMLDWLHWLPVKAGDCLYVPGGMPHAIGAGCFLAELQEPTDLIVIPERTGPNGQPVPEERMHGGLGFETMLDCFVYEGLTLEETRARCRCHPVPAGPGITRLIGDPRTFPFFMDRWETAQGPYPLGGALRTGLVLAGEGSINTVPFRRGDFFLAGADEERLLPKGEMTLLLFGPGNDQS